MAMAKCRECGAEVSDSAKTCPKCGISKPVKKITFLEEMQQKAAEMEAAAPPRTIEQKKKAKIIAGLVTGVVALTSVAAIIAAVTLIFGDSEYQKGWDASLLCKEQFAARQTTMINRALSGFDNPGDTPLDVYRTCMRDKGFDPATKLYLKK